MKFKDLKIGDCFRFENYEWHYLKKNNNESIRTQYGLDLGHWRNKMIGQVLEHTKTRFEHEVEKLVRDTVPLDDICKWIREEL